MDEYIYELMNKRWGAGRVSNISGIGGPVPRNPAQWNSEGKEKWFP